MKNLLFISLIAPAIYLFYMYKMRGMTKSISATYKVAKGFEKIWFAVTLWAVAIPVMANGIELSQGKNFQFLFFFAGALICLVAASPVYWKDKHERTAHLIGSYGCIILGMLACLINLFSIFTLILVVAYAIFVGYQFLSVKQWVKNYVYWIEVAAIIDICLILFLA